LCEFGAVNYTCDHYVQDISKLYGPKMLCLLARRLLLLIKGTALLEMGGERILEMHCSGLGTGWPWYEGAVLQ
jgi:hypothetical protein